MQGRGSSQRSLSCLLGSGSHPCGLPERRPSTKCFTTRYSKGFALYGKCVLRESVCRSATALQDALSLRDSKAITTDHRRKDDPVGYLEKSDRRLECPQDTRDKCSADQNSAARLQPAALIMIQQSATIGAAALQHQYLACSQRVLAALSGLVVNAMSRAMSAHFAYAAALQVKEKGSSKGTLEKEAAGADQMQRYLSRPETLMLPGKALGGDMSGLPAPVPCIVVAPPERMLSWSRQQKLAAEAALQDAAHTMQGLCETKSKVEAADQRLGVLQEGNRSLRTEIGSDQIKLQAAAQVLEAKEEQLHSICSQMKEALSSCCDSSAVDIAPVQQSSDTSDLYSALMRKLQESRAEATAFMQVSHFIMDEALSRKESATVQD